MQKGFAGIVPLRISTERISLIGRANVNFRGLLDTWCVQFLSRLFASTRMV